MPLNTMFVFIHVECQLNYFSVFYITEENDTLIVTSCSTAV